MPEFQCYYCEKEFDEPAKKVNKLDRPLPEAWNYQIDGVRYIGVCPFCGSTRIFK